MYGGHRIRVVRLRTLFRRPSLRLLGLLITAVGAQQSALADELPMATAESVGMSSERLERLTARLERYIDDGQIAGAVSLVAREGRIVHLEAQGFSNRETRDAMEADDIFVIMSMTKPIVSTALMMLYEEGHFLLTDPISKFLPEFASMQVDDGAGGLVEQARPINIRHVLTHTAGVRSGRGGAGSAAPTSVREAVIPIASQPLLFQPGEGWNYGSSTDIVAALVEVISGQSMDAFLRERILQPLGMMDTHYNLPQSKWDRRAVVYSPEDDGSITARALQDPQPTTVFRGVAGLSSTAGDYFKFQQMVLNGGEYNGARLLSPKTVDLMITNHIGDLTLSLGGVNFDGYGFGLGYRVHRDPGQSQSAASPGEFGWGGAWGTYFFTDPVEELIGILMIQISSYRHLNIRQDVVTLATQAIIDAKSSGADKIRGYSPL
jgi:CubicO group peptidase (beta-lactamase class C family)